MTNLQVQSLTTQKKSKNITTLKKKLAGELKLTTQEVEQYLIAYRAYIYGFSLVLMNETKRTSTNVSTSDPDNGHAPINQVGRCRQLRNAAYTDVVSPNVDTLYDPAWMDLSRGPLVLTVPPTESDRYYLLPIMDAYSNVLNIPGQLPIGSRVTGHDRQLYLISGPNWNGTVPSGMTHIEVPTNIAWMLGRIRVKNTPGDIHIVHTIQDGITLTPLTDYPRNESGYTPPTDNWIDTALEVTTPLDRVKAMSMENFINHLLILWVDNPPLTPQDNPILAEMVSIGVTPPASLEAYEAWNRSNFSSALNKAMDTIPQTAINDFTFMKNHTGSPSITYKSVKQHIEIKQNPSAYQPTNGWVAITNERMGNYGTHYMMRAFIAFAGLGANLVNDAMYPSSPKLAALDDGTCYTLTFHNDILTNPPINGGFWSLTMYNEKQLLVPTPSNPDDIQNRYSVGSSSNLKKFSKNGNQYVEDETNGQVIIFIQKTPPVDSQFQSNWLPAPDPTIDSSLSTGDMSLMLRFYNPNEAILNTNWEYPSFDGTDAAIPSV